MLITAVSLGFFLFFHLILNTIIMQPVLFVILNTNKTEVLKIKKKMLKIKIQKIKVKIHLFLILISMSLFQSLFISTTQSDPILLSKSENQNRS